MLWNITNFFHLWLNVYVKDIEVYSLLLSERTCYICIRTCYICIWCHSPGKILKPERKARKSNPTTKPVYNCTKTSLQFHAICLQPVIASKHTYNYAFSSHLKLLCLYRLHLIVISWKISNTWSSDGRDLWAVVTSSICMLSCDCLWIVIPWDHASHTLWQLLQPKDVFHLDV